ncbi:hypothetical protein Vqi01_32480 [Micromonospora qiuiae]|uniref:Uncharacterized protein n=1 Tax=Micromonospora qiuiae TaxID=502268 RepID=A0ABQ4JDK5_9ACTN|nr:hypothetical protein Vqi01_32480 [Micromonospora qiuiae]
MAFAASASHAGVDMADDDSAGLRSQLIDSVSSVRRCPIGRDTAVTAKRRSAVIKAVAVVAAVQVCGDWSGQ